jgi:hypothetical protein
MAFSWHLGIQDLEDEECLGVFGADGVNAEATGRRNKPSRRRGDPNVLASQPCHFDSMRALAREMQKAAEGMRRKHRRASHPQYGGPAAPTVKRCSANVPRCRSDSGVLKRQQPRSLGRYHSFMQEKLKAPRLSGTSPTQHFQACTALWRLEVAAEGCGRRATKKPRTRKRRLDQAERAAAAEARKEVNWKNLAKAKENAEKAKEAQLEVCASLT